MVSSYLLSSEWRSSIYSCFCCIIRQDDDVGGAVNDMVENANMLTKIMHNRLDQHVALRIEDTTKHDNFALSWFRDNIPRFAAFVTLNRHVIEDVKSVDGSTTLLRNPFCIESNFTEITETLGDIEGCYLHYDRVKSKWIRSGKACGSNTSQPKRTCIYRQGEHRKGAEGAPILDFYSKYPTKNNKDATGIRSGYFEHLTQYCGAGFDRTQFANDDLTKNERIFSWDNNTLGKLKYFSFNTCTTIEEKQLHMVSYLFELGCDLMISPDDNVSNSPGFEVPLAIYGGSGN